MSKKCLPKRSLSRLYAEMTTPTKRFMTTKAPKMMKRRKNSAEKVDSLYPGVMNGPLEFIVRYMIGAQFTV